MSLQFQILGDPGRDNALLVRVDSGQALDRLLFDCGDGCLSELPFAEIQAIDHLCFSHLHMDHIGGFDTLFRCTFDRNSKPNRIWGPPETSRILQHRFQGFLWNLHDQMSGTWHVSDVYPSEIRTSRFELREGFSTRHDESIEAYERVIFDGGTFVVEAMTMDHRTPSLAYVVREKPRKNVDISRLAALGLRPGPWLKQLKEAPNNRATVVVDGVQCSLEELRSKLIVETPGDSIAYLTDFLLDEPAVNFLADALRGCQTIVCEGQYRHSDVELARRNFHMTTTWSAELARRANAKELVLFHLSDRYQRADWVEMLEEATRVFPNTRYPEHWNPLGDVADRGRTGT